MSRCTVPDMRLSPFRRLFSTVLLPAASAWCQLCAQHQHSTACLHSAACTHRCWWLQEQAEAKQAEIASKAAELRTAEDALHTAKTGLLSCQSYARDKRAQLHGPTQAQEADGLKEAEETLEAYARELADAKAAYESAAAAMQQAAAAREKAEEELTTLDAALVRSLIFS